MMPIVKPPAYRIAGIVYQPTIALFAQEILPLFTMPFSVPCNRMHELSTASLVPKKVYC